MKKRILVSVVSALAIICVLALGSGLGPQESGSIFAPLAKAQDEGHRNSFERSRSCSSGILRGRYALSLTGTIIGLGPAAEIGNVTFDGHGNLSGNLTASFAGQTVPRTATGTYVVNGDCSGTISADITPGGPINLNLVAVDASGQKAVVIVTSPGLVFSGTLETK